jgi:hypothetical protein
MTRIVQYLVETKKMAIFSLQPNLTGIFQISGVKDRPRPGLLTSNSIHFALVPTDKSGPSRLYQNDLSSSLRDSASFESDLLRLHREFTCFSCGFSRGIHPQQE